MNQVIETGQYSNKSSSALIYTGAGQVLGVFCASSSAGTIKLWNAVTAAAPIIINTTSVVGGVWYPIPFSFTTGLYLTIGGTADVTVSFVPG